MARLVLAVVLTAMLGVTVGCSSDAPDKPDTGTVHGTVTIDGEILPNVSLYFKPTEGRQSIGKTDAEGVYTAMYLIDEEGVKVGPNIITLEYAPDDSGPPIPAKYGFKSELTLDVQPGDNEFNIEMVSE